MAIYYSDNVYDSIFAESKNPRNYWKVMKHRLPQEGNELVTRCNQLKLVVVEL